MYFTASLKPLGEPDYRSPKGNCFFFPPNIFFLKEILQSQNERVPGTRRDIILLLYPLRYLKCILFNLISVEIDKSEIR